MVGAPRLCKLEGLQYDDKCLSEQMVVAVLLAAEDQDLHYGIVSTPHCHVY